MNKKFESFNEYDIRKVRRESRSWEKTDIELIENAKKTIEEWLKQTGKASMF